MSRLLLALLVALCAFLTPAPLVHSAPITENCTGGLLGAPYRGVQAYSNSPHQGSADSTCGGFEATNRGTYGFLYQCVEFVRRFYATNDGPNKGNERDAWPRMEEARDFFDYPTALGMRRFANGATDQPPLPDDILVFDQKSERDVGHVAIVVEVSPTSIRILEQNWSDTGYVTLPAETRADGTYFIPKRGAYPVRGWMGKRSVAQSIVYQPANDIGGQDIWTTSVFSFTDAGGGPGGGLNDDRLIVGGWGDLYYSLIAFDLNTLPTTASKVELQLYMPQARAAGTTALYLDRITAFWDWRTQGTGQDRLRLWWIDRPTAEQWIATALPEPIAGQWYAIDITSLYNAWKAGTYPNYGIQLRPVGAGNNTWADFVSSNSADAAHRPRLVVTP